MWGLPLLVSVGPLPTTPVSEKLPLRKDLQEALYQEAGTQSSRVWRKRATVGKEEAVTRRVF